METVRYAVRVRGRTSDVREAASQEGLEVTIDPVRTVLRGRLPDQAALFGVLNRIRLFDLELIEVRRRPKRAVADEIQPCYEPASGSISRRRPWP
jgi:hypothetical protein